MTRWRMRAIVVLVLAAALAAGCTGRRPTPTPEAGSATEHATGPASTIQRGRTLLVALGQNPIRFDPMVSVDVYSNAVVDNIFEGLYKYDEQYRLQPWLAESVDRPDDVTYVFHLRQGVLFHDGTEMDAEAVKFSIERIRANPRAVGHDAATGIAELSVIARNTLRLVLKEPSETFPTRLVRVIGVVVSPTAVRAMGDERFELNPVGTRPFRFVEFKSDVLVRARRFDGYWRRGADGLPLPYLDAVEWRIIPDAGTSLAALQTGDIHIAPVGNADLPAVKKDARLVVAQQPGNGFTGLALTIDRPPFDNRALRQAAAYAIDRDEIVQAIYEGNVAPAYGPISPTLSWAVDASARPYPHDLRRAREKLVEGGRPGGFDFELWVSAGNATLAQLAELYQAQLARAGIKVSIQTGDANSVVLPKAQRRELSAYVSGFSFYGSDPDATVPLVFETGGFLNYFPYSNEQVDALLRRGRRLRTEEERGPLYREAARIIVEDAPFIFVTHAVARFTGSRKVQGWSLGPRLSSGYSEYWLAN